MANRSHSIFGRTRGIAVLVLVLCAGFASTGFAQKNLTITVVGNRGLEFGDVTRPATSAVGYTSAASAEFQVQGREKKKVRLTVTRTDLSQSATDLPITLTNSDCAYSIDNGVTWNTFSTGTLYHDVKLPDTKNKDKLSTILVRVGGTVNATTQGRGTYNGTVTLTATYIEKSDDDNDDDDDDDD